MLAAMEGRMSGGCQHNFEESSEEELAVLPRHTKVIVTGNNRTKSVLVGLQGVVKKAVGLGGWHWLVLTNGIEVKLQRNALSVIEAPTGDEEDEVECNNTCCNGSASGSIQLHKTQSSRSRHPKGSSDKSCSRSNSFDSQSKGSVSSSTMNTVDLSKLETTALQRYYQHFNLMDANPNPSKEQLIEVVQRHFISQQLDETQVIAMFMQSAKRLKTICN
ncbi:uncharacterized protein LOC141814319 isoform X2 [Curcuma longa]|uniref:uncharacterized protein LOC141814319 isoform X2 n=1 Tax=Curcuma longa TaxID=136217 RepID=UPI003D9F1C6B